MKHMTAKQLVNATKAQNIQFYCLLKYLVNLEYEIVWIITYFD